MARIPVRERRGGFPWWGWLLLALVALALLALLWALLAGDDDDEVAGVDPEVVATEVLATAVVEPAVVATKVLEPEVVATAVVEPEVVATKVVEPRVVTPAAVAVEVAATEVVEVVPEVTEQTQPTQSAAQPTPTTASAAGTGGPITDLTTIFEEQDKASLAGRRVDLQGETAAQVRSVVGDTTFWVGPSQDRQVFVALVEEQDAAGVEGLVDVNEGQTIRITGQMRQLPPMEEARQQWGLSEANAAELENQQIYISAEQVEIIER